MALKISYITTSSILLLILSCLTGHAQVFLLKGSIHDGNFPLTGISILINNKHTGNSDRMGDFEVMANLGDTLKISNAFYQDFKVILDNSLPRKINLQQKEIQLAEVSIKFNKRAVIDSILSVAFSKLNGKDVFRKVFIRQSVTENNIKTVLFNEGVLSFLAPGKDILNMKDAYTAIKINITQKCKVIADTSKKITYASNPQFKLRMGLVPEYFYKQLVPYISSENVKFDDDYISINIAGYNTAYKVFIKYSYIIDRKTGVLKQVKYYNEGFKKTDFFFTEFNYTENNLSSVLGTAKQIRRKQFYSTNDELFLKDFEMVRPENWNFNPNKCGLEKYETKNGNCDDIEDFKRKNNIPDRSYF